ncbi:MAG: MBL fold metallo-hydrolase [Firmicutes bacterium]|nr:MBL fold metallo-hydrolase [Bacillota bacterium]
MQDTCESSKKESKIILVKYYDCGYCENNTKFIDTTLTSKKEKFYAGVFLIKHRDYGNILFDTGYSERIYSFGIRKKIYNILNPTFIYTEDTAYKKLEREGEEDISYIIFSHLHPDHIGGARDFKKARFILSAKCMSEYKKPKFKSLVFKDFLPNDFEKRAIVKKSFKENIFMFKGCDIFNDGTLYLVPLKGHFRGQCGLYIKEHNILLAADACWGQNYIENKNMSIFAKTVQYNSQEYEKTLSLLASLKQKGIKIYFSHDDISNNILYGECEN